ncbi:MAG: hypothetical protein GY874_21185 [Desulfobacteraceae bacterium]|nr:hypothetical protein [Desulfobacteraceae bacterium]
MLSKTLLFMIIAIISFLIISCVSENSAGVPEGGYKKLSEVPDAIWAKVAKMKIFFGHQSVGFNIIDGINDIMKDNTKINLNIVETLDISQYEDGVFAHFRVGENFKSLSKIEHFKKIVLNNKNKNLDLSFLKLCYVDINKNTDIKKIFIQYQNAMGQVSKEVKILHFTVPLQTNQTTWKTCLKSLLGRGDRWEYADNIKRNEYNNMLLSKYKNTRQFVDIAKIESTYDNGKREKFKANGKQYYSMIKEYTYDRGHLNEISRQKVANELLLALANAVE